MMCVIMVPLCNWILTNENLNYREAKFRSVHSATTMQMKCWYYRSINNIKYVGVFYYIGYLWVTCMRLLLMICQISYVNKKRFNILGRMQNVSKNNHKGNFWGDNMHQNYIWTYFYCIVNFNSLTLHTFWVAVPLTVRREFY